MFAKLLRAVTIVVFAVSGAGQAPSSAGVSLQPGIRILVALRGQFDSSVPAGTVISAELLDDVKLGHAQLVPKGSIIQGEVVDCGRSNRTDVQTYVQFAFDTLETKSGTEIPVHAVIQAIAPPVNSSTILLDSAAPEPQISPGSLAVPSVTNATLPNSVVPASHPAVPVRKLQRDDHGVVWAMSMHDGNCILCVQLSVNEKAGQSLIYSRAKQFSLPDKTQLLLRVVR
jgi:hypothetical protein